MAEGAIARRARAQIPQSWDALASSSFYGDELLQARIDYVKFFLFGETVDQKIEASIYNPVVLEYAAKVAALQVIPAAADYWSRKLVSEVRTGTNEQRTYPDTIASLWKIHAQLIRETQEMSPAFELYIGRRANKRILPPAVGGARPYRAPDPWLFPALVTTTDFVFTGEPSPWA